MPKSSCRGTHILKYFSSLVTVRGGKVTGVTEPSLAYCPLAGHLHGYFRKIDGGDKGAVKQAIKKTIEFKIRKYGFFTGHRDFSRCDICVPYGASEILMFALKKRAADAAVVVCDGAGTVITGNPGTVQGIGARMNSLVRTSPVKETIAKLKKLGCGIISGKGLIDQALGVREAVKAGYKKIAVTVSGSSAGRLKEIRAIEAKTGVCVVILAVCTTGTGKDNISLIRRYADIVWSCASREVREQIGPYAVLQLSKQMPVFVLTGKGIDFISSYAEDPPVIKNLNMQKQHLISNKNDGRRVRMGNSSVFIREACLPVSAARIPCFAGR